MNVNGILRAFSSRFKDDSHNEASGEFSRKDKKVLNHLTSMFGERIDDIESEVQLEFVDQDINFNHEMTEINAIRNTRKYTLEQMKEIAN
jgi:hypothetical protein